MHHMNEGGEGQDVKPGKASHKTFKEILFVTVSQWKSMKRQNDSGFVSRSGHT